jgi:hypothetical protein
MTEHASTLAALMLLVGATTATAEPPHPATPAGAYEAMSLGNQHIARALHDAQTVMPLTQQRPGVRKPLSLEQIAAMKRSSTGWGAVVEQMKRKGLLLKDKTLAQIVSRYNHVSRPVSTSAARAMPKTNGEPVARGWRATEALAAPAAFAGTPALEGPGHDADPAK